MSAAAVPGTVKSLTFIRRPLTILHHSYDYDVADSLSYTKGLLTSFGPVTSVYHARARRVICLSARPIGQPLGLGRSGTLSGMGRRGGWESGERSNDSADEQVVGVSR